MFKRLKAAYEELVAAVLDRAAVHREAARSERDWFGVEGVPVGAAERVKAAAANGAGTAHGRKAAK